ncbi:uncharacterized protein LOC126576295 [Anopheles aquasalis]|uniref:uncharacterized protein LOC126576295 n=1 Tax=Anopheles aquasalis TaxID=42839 RepID=UPI00215A4C01|nr:uncharacterized protein LOC126576295 [Anopheles aquasalis]XP_050093467.1 uncharacterized protein LOC126576295 [Anopheles aquasalis]XP_050093468.1 uncharacterized protein LOC126576295 [Anopheles aquasalis]
MNSEQAQLIYQLLGSWLTFLRLDLLRGRSRPTRLRMRPMLMERNEQVGRFIQSVLSEETEASLIRYMRMTKEDFKYILALIAPKIRRQDTAMRLAITARDKFIVTMRYLATGEDYGSLELSYRISRQSISLFIPEVCDSLIILLRDYVKLPATNDEWLRVSATFQDRWQFPHAIGAIDGKRILIKNPNFSGSDNFNYKQFCSIVLLAIVDANSNFIFADVGYKGRISDGGVLRYSSLYRMLENNLLQIPDPECLTNEPPSSIKVPYMLLGDKAFAFTTYCLRPFEGNTRSGSVKRIFNNRHSRARMTVEMAFRMLSARFRVLRTVMEQDTDTGSKIVLATIYVHNFIRRGLEQKSTDSYQHDVDTNDPNGLQEPLPGVYHRPSDNLLEMRMYLAQRFAMNNEECVKYV